MESYPERPLVIAHRALTPGAAENAASSIIRAAQQGADVVELDIRLSLDRRPVVLHDAFLRRSTRARGWVRLWPSFVLRRMRLRDGESDERLTTLRGILQDFPDGLQPALHLKDRVALRSVLGEIRRWGHPDRTWLWLERPADVAQAVSTLPEVRCTLLRPSGWMPENRHAYMRDAQACDARAVSLPWGVIDADLVSLAHDNDLLVFSREEDHPSIASRIDIGVAGIVTDDPAMTKNAIDRALRGSSSRTDRSGES